MPGSLSRLSVRLARMAKELNDPGLEYNTE
jgi:hypothetical protein